MIYPLVRELAAENIPVAVTCRVLGFSKQAFYKWRAKPVCDRDYDDAHLINAAVDVHHDDPEFGYRFITDELAGRGWRASRNRVNKSILDRITQDMARLRRNLDAKDRSRLDDYLENIREIERRIQAIEAYNTAHGPERELPAAPIGVPDSWEEHVKLMFDLQVLAFAADVTRVSSFKLSRDTSNRVFAESGCSTPWHSASHHGERAETIEDQAKINRYHLTMLAYFADKLKNTPDGDGNLLDHSLVFYGSPMGDGNVHGHRRVPLVLLGHANGALAGNRHVIEKDRTPQANVLLTVLHKLGVQVDRVGDSTGTVDI